jgi:hypothetical protein
MNPVTGSKLGSYEIVALGACRREGNRTEYGTVAAD